MIDDDIAHFVDSDTVYEEQGFVHWVCPKGHYFKNQLFDSVDCECPLCLSITDRRNYHTPASTDLYDIMSPPRDEDEDEGNAYLES